MNEAERKYIARQNNVNRVPHPLLEGLVFVALGPATPQQLNEALAALQQKWEENRLAKIIDTN